MMKIVLILAKSADLYEMQHNVAFHLGLHCLPKYPFRGFQCTIIEDLEKCRYLGVMPLLAWFL